MTHRQSVRQKISYHIIYYDHISYLKNKSSPTCPALPSSRPAIIATMPKQQLDQTQPAKVKAKVMAQRKKAKLLKEQAKLEELRKQFPKLFSPEKVKNIEQRKKQLVQSSLKKEVCAEDGVDDVENMPENTNHRRPFSSTHKADTPQKKGTRS